MFFLTGTRMVIELNRANSPNFSSSPAESTAETIYTAESTAVTNLAESTATTNPAEPTAVTNLAGPTAKTIPAETTAEKNPAEPTAEDYYY